MNTITGSSATTMVLVVWHNSLNMLNSLMLVEPVWAPSWSWVLMVSNSEFFLIQQLGCG